MNTQQTLMLFRAVATAQLRPLSRTDQMAFEGADDDAQIGSMPDCGIEALLAFSESVSVEQGCAPQIIVSGGVAEVHWLDHWDENHMIALRVEQL